MEKVRTLTIEGHEVNVSNLRGIIDPGKFEGEWPHAIRDYAEPDESFGDTQAEEGPYEPYHWTSGHRAYYERESGFVCEISLEDYKKEEEAYYQACGEYCEREDAKDAAEAELMDAQAEEKGTCDSCQVMLIQGVRCHETGCPRLARLKDLQERVSFLEENY